jgi:hypothetical protein
MTELKINPEQEPASSCDAQKEAAGFQQGNLDRDEAVRTHIHIAGLIVFWAFVIVGLALFIILAWHLGAPSNLHFLTAEQRNDLQMVLLSFIGSSFVTIVANRWLNPKQ